MTKDRRNRARPTFALLLCPLLSLPPFLGPSPPASLPPLWDPVCPCCTDTVAIRAEESWRPDYRERPVLTHPGLANGVSVRIPELLGGHPTDTNCRGGKRIYRSVEEGIEGDPFRVSVDSTQPPFC